MSLGWQTESAILPSKAKAINVDTKSITSLKALVFEKEQVKLLKKSNGDPSDIIDRNDKKYKRKIDSATAKAREEESLVEKSLKAKAALYEDIVEGRVNNISSEVLNFGTKVKDVNTANEDQREDKSSITNDEQPVKKTKIIYHDYNGSNQQQWQWSKGDTKQHNTDGYSKQDADKVITSWREEEKSRSFIAKELTQRMEYFSKSNTKSEIDSTNADSSGSHHISEAAKIKTQWEKVLESSAREFIHEVHSETVAAKTATSTTTHQDLSQLSGRDAKLELLRRKREELLTKYNR